MRRAHRCHRARTAPALPGARAGLCAWRQRLAPLALLATLILALGSPGPAAAESRPSAGAIAAPVPVRAGIHPTLTRLVFDWPQPVAVTIAQQDTTLALSFAMAATLDLSVVEAAPLPRLAAIRQQAAADATIVWLTLDPGITAVTASNGASTVIDLTAGTPPAAYDQPLPSPTATASDAAAASPADPAAAIPAAGIGAAETGAAETGAAAAVPAGLSEAEVERYRAFFARVQAERDALEGRRQAIAQADAAAAAAAATPTPQPAAEAEAGSPSGPDQPAEGPSDPPTIAPSDSAVRQPPTVPLLTEVKVRNQTEIRLDPGRPVPAAIWRRGSHLWVVLPVTQLSLAPFLTGTQAGILRAYRQFQGPGWIAFRFPLPAEARISARREGRLWQVTVADQVVEPAPIAVAVQSASDGTRHLRAMVPTVNQLELVDPVVGDRLVVLTGEDPGLGLTRAVETVDATLLPSLVGLAIRPNADGVKVTPDDTSVHITRSGGLRLSPLDDVTHLVSPLSAVADAGQAARVFDFGRWGARAQETWHKASRRVMDAVLDASDQQRPFGWLDQARLALAFGLGPEALGHLERAQEALPDLALQPDVAALRGAAQILSFRPAEGLNSLMTDGLQDRPEVALWRAAALSRLGREQEALDQYRQGRSFLADYPPAIQARLGADVLEVALASGDAALLDEALTTLRPALRTNPLHRRPAIMDYFQGEQHSLAGEGQKALAAWARASSGDDWLYRTRALMRLVEAGLPEAEITAADAIERLERLRFGWRGDLLEAKLLRQLARLYLEAGQPRDAFDTYKTAVATFPGTEIGRQTAREMADSFTDLFTDPARASQMDGVTAYALYQDYEELAPEGPRGIAIVDQLADRLIALDLLDLAAALLDKQVGLKPAGPARTASALRLAAMRVLTGDGEGALSALDRVRDAPMPGALAQEARLLRARALAEAGDVDAALILLDGMGDAMANRLRVDLAMEAGRWDDAADALETLLPMPGEALTGDQPGLVLNAAMALSLSGDGLSLSALRSDYEEAMAATGQGYAFDVLTSPERLTDAADVAAVQARLSEVALFDGFLDRYRRSVPQPGTVTASLTDQSALAAPAARAPGDDDPAEGDPAVDDRAVDDAAVDDPALDDPAVDDPAEASPGPEALAVPPGPEVLGGPAGEPAPAPL